jgi:isochorismate hydrolase
MLKELYFTSDNIDVVSKRIYMNALRYSEDRPLVFKKDKAGLLIVDMQDYFLSPDSHAFIPSSPTVMDRIIEFKEICQNHGIPVFFTRHINTQNNAKMLGKWWKDLITTTQPFSEICSELDTSGCEVITKTQYNAFFKTSLESSLKKLKIETLIVTGVMTNLCCETTVRSAFVRGFQPLLPIDLTAAYTEFLHMSSVVNLSYGFTVPTLSGQIIEKIVKE